MTHPVANLCHRRRVAHAVLRETTAQPKLSVEARVAASWAVAATTSMDARLDATLRAIVLEGAFDVPFGAWANKMHPMQAARQGIEAKHPEATVHLKPGEEPVTIAQALAATGWFSQPGTSGYMNMYRYLTEKAIQTAKKYGMGEDRGEDAVAALLVKPGKKVLDEHGKPVDDEPAVKSNARAAGDTLAGDIKEGKATVGRAYALLSTMVVRRVQDIAKQRKKDETHREGPSRDDEGKERDPIERIRTEEDKPSINEAVRASFHDPNDPLGKYIRGEMRRTFEDAYADRATKRAPSESGRARAEKPPMLHLLDKMEDPDNHVVVDTPNGPVRRMVIPKLRDVADDLGVARSTVKQRHTLPLMMKFTERLRSDPKIKATLSKELTRRGYSREDIQEFFDRPNPFGVASVSYGMPTIKILDPQYQDG